jgi:diguanylate cyclase (GGDEF)-like protein/PAS domain S-box-containing protein
MVRVLAAASDGMLIANELGIITTVNPAAERITGVSAATLLGRSAHDLPRLIHGDLNPSCRAVMAAIERTLVDGESSHGLDVWFTRNDGVAIYGIIDIVPLRAHGDTLDGILLTLHDVTDRMLMEQRLSQLALHDALTGLPNRRLFDDRAEHALAQAKRDGGSVGVLLIDLDNFKPVNDRFGHPAGDKVLVEVARRLSVAVRDVDTVARFGGDEFVILLQSVRDFDEVMEIRDRLSRVLAEPHTIGDEVVTVTASIGISLTASPEDRASDLLHHADGSMYAVKRDRRAGPLQTNNDRSLFRST